MNFLSRVCCLLLAASTLPLALRGQVTLVNQGVASMTAALTTTVTSTATTPYTYTSSFMNDPVGTGGAKANLGITATATAGVSPVTYGGTKYTNQTGSIYNAAGFWIDSGTLANTATATTAANAGVAFTVASAAMGTGAATYYVGVDLVKVSDTATTSGAAGTATVDFFVGVSFSGAVTTNSTTAKVFVVGADTAAGKNVGPSTIAFTGAVQYLANTGTAPISEPTYVVNNASTSIYLATGATNYLSFGALYTDINSALRTIYGVGTATQWNQGDAVRFVPLTVDGLAATATPSASNSDFMGGTVNAGVSIPFGTNATAAITDAYVTGNNFTLTRTGIDGIPVPEPTTWISSGALLMAGLVVRWRQAPRKQPAADV